MTSIVAVRALPALLVARAFESAAEATPEELGLIDVHLSSKTTGAHGGMMTGVLPGFATTADEGMTAVTRSILVVMTVIHAVHVVLLEKRILAAANPVTIPEVPLLTTAAKTVRNPVLVLAHALEEVVERVIAQLPADVTAAGPAALKG